jgi:CheY-like chemotaxis protein
VATPEGGTSLTAFPNTLTRGELNAVPLETWRPDDAGQHAGFRERPLVVLIVDDNHDMADSLTMLVRLWGHDARVAYDGAGALASAQAEPPDAVLVDIAMPRIDGFEAARLLRLQAPGRDMLFVAVTGFSEAALGLRWRHEGFSHFVMKPLDLEQLKLVLARHGAALAQGCP